MGLKRRPRPEISSSVARIAIRPPFDLKVRHLPSKMSECALECPVTADRSGGDESASPEVSAPGFSSPDAPVPEKRPAGAPQQDRLQSAVPPISGGQF